MTAVNFGLGTLILRRTDAANSTPSLLGVTQEFTVDIDQTMVELYGQNKQPFDVAPSKQKITAKAKFARLQVDVINSLMLGATETSASGFDMASQEAVSGTATTFTVTNGSAFVQDLGVFYHSNGQALTLVTATPGTGSYIAGAASVGTYTRAAADATVALDVYYTYSVTNLVQSVLSQELMGTGPQFEVYLSNSYTFNNTKKKFNMKLNACRSSRLTFPMTNMTYTIPEMDIEAFADASGVVGTWALSE